MRFVKIQKVLQKIQKIKKLVRRRTYENDVIFCANQTLSQKA